MLIPDAASLVAYMICADGVFLASSIAASSAFFYASNCFCLSSSSSSRTAFSCSISASLSYCYFLRVASCFSLASSSPAVASSIILPKIPLDACLIAP
mgnify:CR=1 FL=1